MKLTIGSVCALALLFSAPVMAQPKASSVRVAVLLTLSVNLKPDEVLQLEHQLRDAIEKMTPVDAVSARDRGLVVDGVCLASKPCWRSAAEKLGATRLLFATATRVGEQVRVDFTILDVALGTVDNPEPIMMQIGLLDESRMRGLVKRAVGPYQQPMESKVVSRPRHMDGVSWTLAGASLASLAVGAYLSLGSVSDFDSCDQRGGCPDDRVDEIANRMLAGDILLGTSLAAAVSAGLLFWFSGGDEVVIRPTVSTSGASVGVSWSF